MRKPIRKIFTTGFTLIEFLVYTAVLSIVIAVISSFIVWSIHSTNKVKAMRETLDNARRAMEIITYEIKEAKSIYTPNTTSTQLSLETTKYLPEGEETTYIDFYLCEKRLCFKKEGQGPAVLTSDSVEINNLVFTQIISGETPSIQINLTAGYKNPDSRPELQALVNLISTASLRSY